jgi:hypothetical protein
MASINFGVIPVKTGFYKKPTHEQWGHRNDKFIIGIAEISILKYKILILHLIIYFNTKFFIFFKKPLICIHQYKTYRTI